MSAGTNVYTFMSTDTGAPTMSGTAGALIALLDACLKDGFNLKSVASITRSGSTATVTVTGGHGFRSNAQIPPHILIAGADQAEYNGTFKIGNVTTNTFDFTVTGTPTTPATGTITAKVAPLGWSKAFSGTNKAAYKSVEATATQLYLRVDDNNPSADTNKTARLVGYETMTDVDTGTGPFPTAAQVSGGLWVTKSSTSDSTARPWVLIGDGYEFWLFNERNAAGYPNILNPFHFGDPDSEMASDPYGCFIGGDYGTGVSSTPQNFAAMHQVMSSVTTQSGHYLARGSAQTGGSIACGKAGDSVLGSTSIGGPIAAIAYPAQHNNGLYVTPLILWEASVPRAVLRSVYQPLHDTPLNHLNTAQNVDNLPGRTLLAVAIPYSSSTPGEIHVDITGPWR
jgi:hypothetical protein